LRYEDFVAHPADALAAVLRFLNMPIAGTDLVAADGAVRLRPGHQVSGNPSRFTGAPTTLRPDERWRENLPTPSRLVVTALTAPLLARYRYLPAGRTGRNGGGAAE
jgi:hypothetical protein